MKLKFRSKFNHCFTSHGYFGSAIWKALYSFKIKRTQEARQNTFFCQMFKIMKSLRSSKCLTFATQKANACSTWTAFSVFDWNYLFWLNLVQKVKIISSSWKIISRLFQICSVPWWCSLFLFLTGNTFLGKFGPKNQNCQFELKFRTTISFIIFWDFSMFYQIFLSPHVKRWAIITYKHGIYELPQKLPNDLRLRTIGN